jgi:hypothetical protein
VIRPTCLIICTKGNVNYYTGAGASGHAKIFQLFTFPKIIGRSLVRSQLVSMDFILIQNSSDRTVALGSTQSLIEISSRIISWGEKAAGA